MTPQFTFVPDPAIPRYVYRGIDPFLVDYDTPPTVLQPTDESPPRIGTHDLEVHLL